MCIFYVNFVILVVNKYVVFLIKKICVIYIIWILYFIWLKNFRGNKIVWGINSKVERVNKFLILYVVWVDMMI